MVGAIAASDVWPSQMRRNVEKVHVASCTLHISRALLEQFSELCRGAALNLTRHGLHHVCEKSTVTRRISLFAKRLSPTGISYNKEGLRRFRNSYKYMKDSRNYQCGAVVGSDVHTKLWNPTAN